MSGYDRWHDGDPNAESWASEPPVDWAEVDSEAAQEAREEAENGDA